MERTAGRKSCFAVHSLQASLRWPGLPRKFLPLTACRTANFSGPASIGKVGVDCMSDRHANSPGNVEPSSADLDAATRRLMAALDALESAVERRRDADRDENELASRIQALGVDRSRLADQLDGSLVKSRRLERVNREIAERLDAAIGAIRAVLHAGEDS